MGSVSVAVTGFTSPIRIARCGASQALSVLAVLQSGDKGESWLL